MPNNEQPNPEIDEQQAQPGLPEKDRENIERPDPEDGDVENEDQEQPN